MRLQIHRKMKGFLCWSRQTYILVTDSEEDDAECWILKDTSPEESSEAIYEFVEDEKELNGIMGVFEELLEDVEIER